MSTNTIAPVLPEGAGYGVVVGIGVSAVFIVETMSDDWKDIVDTKLMLGSSSSPFSWLGSHTYRSVHVHPHFVTSSTDFPLRIDTPNTPPKAAKSSTQQVEASNPVS